MYPGKHLGDWTTILSDVLNTGEKIVRDVTAPNYGQYQTNPMLPPTALPRQINPLTGQYVNPTGTYGSDYTVPLMIGGGVLLLVLLAKRRRA
jgi:hypothetical protein